MEIEHTAKIESTTPIGEFEETVWKSVKLARDAARPYTEDIIKKVFLDFREIHGDRRYADDPAIICGTATLDKKPLMIIGHQKGRDTKQRRWRNFGMPKPEGYRKALRTMKMAEKFRRPLITFIDTPGAYPGIDAEERGQAEAIAKNLLEMSQLRIPIIVVIIGEGGSGGALAIGVGDYILMLENAIYSVITPEGCAAILWKSSEKASEAAAALGLNAEQLLENNIVDEIIREKTPWTASGERNQNGDEVSKMEPAEVCENLTKKILFNLDRLGKIDERELISRRFEKFKKMGFCKF